MFFTALWFIVPTLQSLSQVSEGTTRFLSPDAALALRMEKGGCFPS